MAKQKTKPASSVFRRRNHLELPEAEDRLAFCSMVVHTAVVSHGARDWAVAAKWAELLTREFFEHGRELRSNGLPVPPHMDEALTAPTTGTARASAFLAVSNLENFTLPSLALLSGVLPKISDWEATAMANRTKFKSMIHDDEEEEDAGDPPEGTRKTKAGCSAGSKKIPNDQGAEAFCRADAESKAGRRSGRGGVDERAFPR